MSSNSDSDIGRQPLGSRVNFFDSEAGEFDPNRQPGDPTTHQHDDGETATSDAVPSLADHLGRSPEQEVTGVNREAWVAGSVLRSYGNPTLHCPECWYEYDIETPLSDPKHHLPHAERLRVWDEELGEWITEVVKHDHRRHRHCPECGVISFGGVLADRPTEAFLAVVDWFLDAQTLPSRRQRNLREYAHEHKQRGRSDESIMEDLVRAVRLSLSPDQL